MVRWLVEKAVYFSYTQAIAVQEKVPYNTIISEGLCMPSVRREQHVPMLLRPMRHLTLLLLLLSGMLLGVRSAAALEVGDKAPDFTLPSTTGEPISLHQFLGKKHLLIEFYVRAFGPT